MSRIWVREIINHRTARQTTRPCAWGDEKIALEDAVKELDLPNPMWLGKHEREWASFRHTAFLPDHFVERVDFDKLEIEYLDDTGKKRKSPDPRNAF